MARFFKQLGRAFRTAQGVVQDNYTPSSSLNNAHIRQSQIQNWRDGVYKRNMIRWFLPETGIIEMYINPQDIKYSDSKHTTESRSRGGYIVQYWGEELGKLSINGTTGSSGVEGINVLYDIYRNEQLVLDNLALASQAAKEKEAKSSGGFLGAVGDLVGLGSDDFFDRVESVLTTGNIDPNVEKPTLASIAFQVEMYWSGWVFRGYFKNMNVTESANKIGLFDYSIDFTVTQKRGLRLNYMPWHRSAVNGPSNSDPRSGIPYSFGSPGQENTIRRGAGEAIEVAITTLDEALRSDRPIM